MGRKKLQAIQQWQQIQRRLELMKVRSRKVPVTVPFKTVVFAPTVKTPMMEIKSVASFLPVHGDKSLDNPPMSTKAATPGRCGRVEKRDLRSSEAQNSNNGTVKVDRMHLTLTIKVAFSGRYVPKMQLRKSSGNPLE